MFFLEELARGLLWKISVTHDLTRKADYRLAELYLDEFTRPYSQQCMKRINAICRAGEKNAMRNKVEYEFKKPTLFNGNEPTLDLFVYNIPFNPGKKKLEAMLRSFGQEDFTIVKVHLTGRKTCMNIKCHSLASSTKMQCDALLRKIWMETTNGKRFYLSVKPDQRASVGVLQGLKLEEAMFKVLPSSVEALRAPDIISKVISYLGPVDVLNLLCALHGLREPCYRLGTTDLLMNHERYVGTEGLDRLFVDARQLIFANIWTGGCGWKVEASTIRKLLRLQAEGRKEKIRMQTIDLSGGAMTKEVIEDISNICYVKSLKLAEVSTVFDVQMQMEGLEELSINENKHARLRFLENSRFFCLRVLELNKCEALYIEQLCRFVGDNEVLEELYLKDINSIDTDTQCWRILEAVFNNQNRIRIFHFEYIKNQSTELEFVHQPVLRVNTMLEEINIENNKYIQQNIQEIVNKARVLERLNIKGLEPQDQGVDFSAGPALRYLQMSYHQGIQRSLSSLSNSRICEIKIDNHYGKNNKRNRSFNVNFALSVVRNAEKFRLYMSKCKVIINAALASALRRYGARWYEENDILEIVYRRI